MKVLKSYSINIPGRAVPQARPRFARHGGRVVTYEPKQCAYYKELVQYCAVHQCGLTYDNTLYAGPVEIIVTERREPPSRWSKAKRLLAFAGEIMPIVKPDTDNILKIIKDALTGLMWIDDAQVVSDKVAKVYADAANVEVIVRYLAGIEGNE